MHGQESFVNSACAFFKIVAPLLRMQLGQRGAFDLRLGYAMTIHRAEGLTFDNVILIFEDWCVPGWGYTAVSRVRCKQGLHCIGTPSPRHFEPRL